ncbi:MAG: helicase-exonuclease AddAB subunit AddA [Clostridia bacterium]
MEDKWTKEQRSAIDTRNCNLLVSASAGSGKTAVLVERVVKKVVKDNIDIDKLLVVTFTNASAIELKERLLSAIYKELDKDPDNTFLKRQIGLLNRSYITTIHAFCLDLIRSNFHILDIDPNFKICDDTQSQILKAKAMEKILESKYMQSDKEIKTDSEQVYIGLYKILELFSGKDERLVEYLLSIYSYIQSFDYPFLWLKKQILKYNITDFDEKDLVDTEFGAQIFKSALTDIEILVKRTKDLKKELLGKEDFVKYIELLDSEIEMLESIISSKNISWDRLYEKLQNMKFGTAPRYKGENIELKEKVLLFRKDVLKKQIEVIKKSIYAPSKDILEDNLVAYSYIKYIYDFLILFDKEYIAQKSEINVIDFSDIEHLALELLLNIDKDGKITFSDVAIECQKKFVEVYTDEYQDTSFVQEAILNSLSNGNNRFMVGDIKQSIYKFRQAMPEIFNGKYEDYKKIENTESTEQDCAEAIKENKDIKTQEGKIRNTKIILAKNFRSRAGVLLSINYIFEQIMSKEIGECNYCKDEVLKFGALYYKEKEGIDYKTDINIVDLKSEDLDCSNINLDEFGEDAKDSAEMLEDLKDFEIESIYIAKKIQNLKEEFSVFDNKKNSFRKVAYSDIVILLRNIKGRGSVLEQTLKKYDIPAFSDAMSSLFEGDEVKLVLSFLRIIDNPLQDIHMVSVMYSIIGGFSLKELVYIRNYDKKSKMFYTIKKAKEKLEKKSDKSNKEDVILEKINAFLEVLNTFIMYSRKYLVSELLTRMYKETSMYYQYALEEMSDMKKANLRLLIEIAIKNEKQTNGTIGQYIAYVDSLKDKVDSSTSAAKILGENEDVVRIMTIHKSKGLEFPIVILCDTAKKYNLRSVSAPLVMHHSLGVGINVVNEEHMVTYPSVIKQAIKQRVIKETKSEELRMLYVALTRAKEKLVIFGTLKDYEKFKEKQFIIEKEGKVDSTSVMQNNSYLENIVMALKKYEDEINTNSKEHLDIFNINIIKACDNKSMSVPNEEEIGNDAQINTDIFIKSLIESSKISKDILTKKENIYKERLEYEYKYLEDTKISQRISVSKLKDIDKENISIEYFKKPENNSEDILKKYPMPQCLQDISQNFSPVRKGTLTHFILEHLDFSKNYTMDSLKEYIATKLGDIGKEQVNIRSIYQFLNSKIGIQLKQTNKIYREVEFILNNADISSSTIQGVIDMYYINKDGHVILVDFKTDKIKDSQVFKKLYKKQLEIYKKAVETLICKKVEKAYIYSFNLNKEIEINEGE